MTEDQIKHMAERFLTWRLPENFNPDGGIKFDPAYRSPHGPSGTNLFGYTEAVDMVSHMAKGLPVKVLQPHQQRVVEEKNDLGVRRGKLLDFLSGDKIHDLPEDDQLLLQDQCNAMTTYLEILEKRIARF